MTLPETTTPEALADHMGKTMINISQEELKAALRYEPETGLFFWVKDVRYGLRPGDVAGFVTVYGYVNIKIKQKAYPARAGSLLGLRGDSPAASGSSRASCQDSKADR